MRRQVKPFVTEYRGAPRRLKDQVSASDLPQDPQPAQHRSRSHADAQRVFQPDPSEDSYEAALRAADALFAPAQRERSPARPQEAVSPFSDDAPSSRSAASAGDPWASRPDELVGRGPISSLPASDAEAAPRRILQAIEAPGEDRFAAMEAERAPKRRGRKPGSRNKPKPVPADDWMSSVPAVATVAEAERVERRVAPMRPAQIVEPALLALDVAVDEMGPSLVAPSRSRGERYGRKRAELRPGERWKRRLPKVAW